MAGEIPKVGRVVFMALSPSQQKIVHDFQSLEDEFDKYTYLTHLGNQLGLPPASLKCDAFLVSGCQSETWVQVLCDEDGLALAAYSDTLIVRGLLYILRESVKGVSPDSFSGEGCMQAFEQAGLLALLTASRRSGLQSILDTVAREAAAFAFR